MRKSRHIAVFIRNHPVLPGILLCLVTGLAGSLPPFDPPRQKWLGWGAAACAGVTLLLWAVLRLLKRVPAGGDGGFWWVTGYFLRYSYILRFPYHLMQHDVGNFGDKKGHAQYIAYLYAEGHLPDFDVRTRWQFYHPPLHHALEAVWLRLTAWLPAVTGSEESWRECTQVLPFAYSCAFLAIFGLILRHFGAKGAAFTIPFAIMAVHPSQIILAGSINNDMLSILFLEASALLALRWYRRPQLRTILGLALTIGLGMSSKLSAWMAAPAAAFLFLARFLKNRADLRKFLPQFAAFAAVCVPLGLWWYVRNLIGWGVPPAYIPMLADESAQFVGNHPIGERLLDFSPQQFAYIYDCYEMYGQPYSEYNPLIGLLKTAVFDEFVGTARFPHVAGAGEVLFWSQTVLAAAAFAAMIWSLCKKRRRIEKISLTVTYAVTLVSYYSFCLTFPHTCTQSFRYAVPTLFTSLAFLGIVLRGNGRRWVKVVTGAAAGVFCAASMGIYGVLLYL